MAALTRNLYEQLLEQQQRYVSTQNQLVLETRQAQQTQRQLESAQEKINSTEEESALLLTQLHQVQEELERVFLKQQDSEQKGQHAQGQASALQAEKTQLKDLEEENDLLLTQLHQVQEELERYYLENQQLKSGKAPAQKQRLYGAEHRVKQHLSYRLGATMIAHSRSLGGWLRLPFLLRQEAKAYKRDQRGKVPQSLPPLHTYADAYEGERCKQHLSYRLGQTLLKHIKTPWGWMWLPFALVGTVRGFRKARV
jgi:chemotaxis protein histidine kinase CheA